MEGEKLKLVIDYDNTMVNSSRTIINKLHWKNRHDGIILLVMILKNCNGILAHMQKQKKIKNGV